MRAAAQAAGTQQTAVPALGGIPVSIRQPGSAAPIQQAGAVVQVLTVPAELPAQALPGAAGSAPLPGSMFNIWVALAAIWAAGVVVLLVRAAAGYCRLRRMVTLACKTPDGCYTCAAVATPFTLGVLRPRIYMPQSLLGAQILTEKQNAAQEEYNAS